MYGAGYKLEKTHDLNHDLTFSAHTFNCVCHSKRSMFRVLGIYNFGFMQEKELKGDFLKKPSWELISFLF
jgi:hypothetical protein